MKKLAILFVVTVGAYAETCPRDMARLSRTQQFDLREMDKLVGTYQLSENCGEMKITTDELCKPSESHYSLVTSYNVTIDGLTNLNYYVQPESRPSSNLLTIGPRKIEISNRKNSGGGILTRYRKAILNFKKEKLKSVDIIETSGVIFQSVDFETHCEVKE